MDRTSDYLLAIGFALLFGMIGVAASLTPVKISTAKHRLPSEIRISPAISAAVLEFGSTSSGQGTANAPLRLNNS